MTLSLTLRPEYRGRFALATLGTASLAAGWALGLLGAHLLDAQLKPPPAIAAEPREEAPLPPSTMSVTPQQEEEAAPEMAAAQPTSPAIVAPEPEPAWRANAVPAGAARAMVAVIIDDMGVDRRRSDRMLGLPAPLTLSYLTYAPHAGAQVAAARGRGHELMMHLPMQPLKTSLDAGPGVLTQDLPVAELQARIDRDLDRFTGYVGVNNHMGSRFTAYAPGMALVMAALHRRGLLFIDSLTTGDSVGLAAARVAQVPAASRNLFLDDADDPAEIRGQLAKAEALAKRSGSAIVIGHPRDNTYAALAEWLPALRQKGITLVPVTTVIATDLSP